MQSNGSTDSGLSELEAKRQAVLASMKKRKSSPQASNNVAIQINNTQSVRKSGMDDNDANLEKSLHAAVLDLRSLGWSFDEIVDRAGIKREFLAKFYTTWKFVVPKIDPLLNNDSEAEQAPVFIPKWHDQRSHSNSPIVHQRPLFNNKYNRVQVQEKPEWLKDLVIDLSESSDEEESEEEEEEEEDEEQEEEEEEGNSSNDASNEDEEVPIQVENDKKRKLEDDDYSGQKKLLKTDIEELSTKIRQSESSKNPVSKSWQILQKELKEKEAQLAWLKKQVSLMESETSNIKTLIKKSDDGLNNISEWKTELASKLIQLEELENEEQKQIELDKKRASLKAKLQQQMKLKRQREAHEKEEKKRIEEEEEEEEIITVASSENDVNEDEKEEEDDDTMNSNGMVSSDTIHKIPKHQASHFTPYHSLGFKKQNNVSVSDNDQLCPIELTQGKCKDKTCKFTHLSVNQR